MKRWNGADHERIHYEKAPQQPVNIEVLHSNERPGITRVFGTSTPPEGLSGAIRRWAFKYSEGKGTHWMWLILADRVNVVEGVFKDLKQGVVPNLIEELGWKAEWQYNRKKFGARMAIKTIAVATIAVLLTRKNKK